MFVSPSLAAALSVVLTAGRVTGLISTGRTSCATVTGGRGSAINGVVSSGVVSCESTATLASRQPGPPTSPCPVQSVATRRASYSSPAHQPEYVVPPNLVCQLVSVAIVRRDPFAYVTSSCAIAFGVPYGNVGGFWGW